MARVPEAGKVKTRMQPDLSPERCASLYRAFLGDAIDLSMSIEGVAHFLSFTPVEGRHVLERMVPPGVELIPQAGHDLGSVMDGLMKALFARGYSPVVLFGSDIPALQPRALDCALAMLKDCDICLGPSRDGGYYLVGAGNPVSPIFQGIPWSTPRVLELTLQKAASAGLKTAMLEELEDVDTVEELQSLEKEIIRLRGEPGARIPVRTEAWLKNSSVSLKQP
jgi:hypothetical protein